MAWTGLRVAVGMDRYSGTLTVDPKVIRFTPTGASTAVGTSTLTFTHRNRDVVVVQGRLRPPWMSSGVVLVDPAVPYGWTGVVLLPSWTRKRLIAGLASCGYSVRLIRTWFSNGENLGSVSDLERLPRAP